MRYALEGTVSRFEVHICGPVVGEVVSGATGCAGSQLGNVGAGHGGVEGVASDLCR